MDINTDVMNTHFSVGVVAALPVGSLVVVPLFQGSGTEYLGIREVKLNTFSLWSVRGGQHVLEMGNYFVFVLQKG